MELKVVEYQKPVSIEFNYEEIKKELAEKVKTYETMVYTDDQIKLAKADRASLNKFKKALNDERIRREREYLIPFEDFKAKVNELISIIDKPVAIIDKQIKEYEAGQKTKKQGQIETTFKNTDKPDWLKLEQIMDEKWLNASTNLRTIADEMAMKVRKINEDMATLGEMPEFAFEAKEVYKRTLSISDAVNEGKRMAEIQRRKEKEAQRMAEMEAVVQNMNPPEVVRDPDPAPFPEEEKVEKRYWVSFSANLTIKQAEELKAFFVARNIEFKRV